MASDRVHIVTLKLTGPEYAKIRENVKAVHDKMGTARYMKQMALHGYYVQCSFRELKKASELLGNIKDRLAKASNRLIEKCPLELYYTVQELEKVESQMNILITSVMDT